MIFGNYIFNYIVGRSLAENHPTKDFEHCINRRQVKHNCSVCADICPEHVYSGTGSRKADYTRCINCNLCAAACPTRCIASSASNVSRFLKLLKTPERGFSVSCGPHEEDTDLNVYHFASLPWEYLACAGLQKKVSFLTDSASGQDDRTEMLWQETLAYLKKFFGETEFDRRFVFSSQSVCADEQEINRRELFQKMTTELRSKFSSFVPSENMMDGLLFRYLLNEILAGDSACGSFGWIIPVISSRCKGCGVCEKLCPQNAITIKKSKEQFIIYLFPLRCNHCGLCRKTCIHQAVDGFALIHISSLKPVILFDSQELENTLL